MSEPSSATKESSPLLSDLGSLYAKRDRNHHAVGPYTWKCFERGGKNSGFRCGPPEGFDLQLELYFFLPYI